MTFDISKRKKEKLVCGIGINDSFYNVYSYGKRDRSYVCWKSMLERCYLKSDSHYFGCSVCKEWLYYSNFKKWFDENYVEGYQLDKDILIVGNKEYSPTACVFVPKNINVLLTNSLKARGEYLIGVKQYKHGFIAQYTNNKYKRIGKCFSNEYDAYLWYKENRERTFKEIAQKYFDENKISKKIYDTLNDREVFLSEYELDRIAKLITIYPKNLPKC